MARHAKCKVSKFFRPALEILEERVVLDDTSASLLGVNARFLTTPTGTVLDGTGVRIGRRKGVGSH
jgi:hypothetical protein